MSDTTRMEITPEQYALIEDCLPRQRGNVSLSNLDVLNAILYVAEHGCKWRGLPKRFGNWHTIYTRMNRWTKAGVLDRVFEQLQANQIVRVKLEAVSLDSTSVKVHPDGTGALKKTAHKPSASPAADGTRGCSYGPDVFVVARAGTRCAGGTRTAAPNGDAGAAPASADGSRLRGQRDAAARS